MTHSAPRRPLRQAMPIVAAWIDLLRSVFGAEQINAAIRQGMSGGTDFHASENGHTVGHLPPEPGLRVHPDQMYLRPRKEPPCTPDNSA